MNVDSETQEALDRQSPATREAKKAPRKPRPSEIAAKKAKAAAKRKRPKPKIKKTGKSKRKAPAKKVRMPAKKKAGKRKTKGNTRPLARTARIDMKLLPKHKNKVFAAARKRGIPATIVLQELIEKMK